MNRQNAMRFSAGDGSVAKDGDSPKRFGKDSSTGASASATATAGARMSESGSQAGREDGCKESVEVHLGDLFFLCVDVETGGSSYKDPMIAVGFSVQNALGKQVSEKLICIAHAWEDVRNKDFWERHEDSYSYMADGTRTLEPAAAATAIDDYLGEILTKYPDAQVVCDNAAFDGGRLNHFLSMHDMATIEERRKWKKIFDVHDFAVGRAVHSPSHVMQEVRHLYSPGVRRRLMDGTRNPYKKTHLPHDDAAYTLFLYTSHLRNMSRQALDPRAISALLSENTAGSATHTGYDASHGSSPSRANNRIHESRARRGSGTDGETLPYSRSFDFSRPRGTGTTAAVTSKAASMSAPQSTSLPLAGTLSSANSAFHRGGGGGDGWREGAMPHGLHGLSSHRGAPYDSAPNGRHYGYGTGTAVYYPLPPSQDTR